MKKPVIPTLLLVLCALFVALITICAWISIPMPSGISVTLQVLGVLLCAALLPPGTAALTIIAYALLGLAGIPVFSQMKGGVGVLFGITGGYIIGFIPCAWITGVIIRKWGRAFWKQAVAMAIGTLVCYLFGTLWFMVLDAGNKSRSFATVAGLCVLPYLPFDAAKIIVASLLSKRLYQPLCRIIGKL